MDQIIEFIRGVAGLATGIGAIVTSAGLHVAPRFASRFPQWGAILKKLGRWISRKKLTLLSGAVGVVIFVIRLTPDTRGPTEIMLGRAWRHFKQVEYQYREHRIVARDACSNAVFWAKQCVEQYAWKATQLQQAAVSANALVPSEGPVSEDEKKAIFARGPLNDVSTCIFIWGRSLEYLDKKSEAQSVYQSGTNLFFAMTLNEAHTGFWSPVSASLGRLMVLAAGGSTNR